MEKQDKVPFRCECVYHRRPSEKEIVSNGNVFGGAWRTAMCMEGGE